MTPSFDLPETSGIYCIRCVPTGKIYIGSAVNLEKRYRAHRNALNGHYHHNEHLQNAWDKYGPDAFCFEVLEFVLTPFLLERENHWFEKLQPFGDRGFNLARRAESPTVGYEHTDETRAKISASHIGIRPWLGKKHTPQTKEKMRQSRLGHVITPQGRERIRACRVKTIIVTFPDGTEQTACGIVDFCRQHSLDPATLIRVAQGRQSAHKGYKARYIQADDA